MVSVVNLWAASGHPLASPLISDGKITATRHIYKEKKNVIWFWYTVLKHDIFQETGHTENI